MLQEFCNTSFQFSRFDYSFFVLYSPNLLDRTQVKRAGSAESSRDLAVYFVIPNLWYCQQNSSDLWKIECCEHFDLKLPSGPGDVCGSGSDTSCGRSPVTNMSRWSKGVLSRLRAQSQLEGERWDFMGTLFIHYSFPSCVFPHSLELRKPGPGGYLSANPTPPTIIQVFEILTLYVLEWLWLAGDPSLITCTL